MVSFSGTLFKEQLKSLSDTRETLVKQMENAGFLPTIDSNGDDLHVAQVTIERQMSVIQASKRKATLTMVDGAIDRIKNGTYGICVSCGGVIPPARLEALPYTDQCISCAKKNKSKQ